MSSRQRYRWASLVIESDLALPELPRTRCDELPHIVVRRFGARRRLARGRRCHEWRLQDGTRWASIARGDGGHLLRFRRFAQFVLTDHNRSIGWRAPATTRPETIRHLLLDQVLPLVAAGRSMMGLHASAVAINGAAVAFAGPTSRGKSTLAASFALAGYPVVTDDCLLLQWRRGGLQAVPTYPSIRLWKDSADRLLQRTRNLSTVAEYTAKLRVDLQTSPAIAFRRRPVPVGRIYLLERGLGRARIEELSRRQAYIELIKASFRLDPSDRTALQREVAPLAAMACALPIARLHLPSRLEALDAVRSQVLSHIARVP